MEKTYFKRHLTVFLFFLLFFLALIPRSVEVINGNFLFLLDQGRDWLAVKNIAWDHKLTLIGTEIGYGVAGFQGIFHGPVYFYLLTIPFLLFDGDPYGGVLLMFIFGLLTIVLSFFLGQRLLGNMGGLVMALLVSVSPPLISQSRFIWSPHPASLFIVTAFYFVYLAQRKNGILLFLASFFSAFIYNFEMAITIPLCLALTVYMLFVVRLRQFRQYLFFFGGFVLAFLPAILFELRHGFQALKGLMSYFFTAGQSVSLQINSLRLFNYTLLDTFPRQFIFPQVLMTSILIAALLFFLIKDKRREVKSFLLFLFLLTLATFTTFLFIRTNIFEYYLIHINFVFIVVFSYLLMSSYLQKQVRFQLILTAFFVTYVFFGTKGAIDTFKRDLFDYGGMVKIKGKIDALDYIYIDAKGEQFGLLVFSPPIYTYPYDYLVWWYGQRKYGYLPHQDKNGLFYLLIERDTSQPWTYQGWLNTVVKSGTVVREIELPSGFLIQKRYEK